MKKVTMSSEELYQVIDNCIMNSESISIICDFELTVNMLKCLLKMMNI